MSEHKHEHDHEHDHEHEHEHEHEHHHEHEHEHHHEHEHEHDHDHEHEHHHDHEDSCGCGHEHDHEHHHDHEDSCGCGHEHDHEHHHDHEDSCGCGYDHEHHHDHEDSCGCGHDHEHGHHHDHEDSCGCGHDHEHGHGHDHGNGPRVYDHDHGAAATADGEARLVYILEGLDCPNCAQKIEDTISKLPEVKACTVTYANKQMRISAASAIGLTALLQKTIDAVEDGVTVVERKRVSKDTSATRIFILEGLDCPNCAQKIENTVNKLPEVEVCTVTYANKQMRVKAPGVKDLRDLLQKTIDAVEDGITVVERQRSGKAENNTKLFMLEGLTCGTCAMRIEAKVAALPYVEDATVNQATMQLSVVTDAKENLRQTLQYIVDGVTDEVKVTPVVSEKLGGNTAVYILQGLDCPSCAQKVEDKLNSLPEIDNAIVTYANTQVRVTANNASDLKDILQKAIDAVEDGITVIPKESGKKNEPAPAAGKQKMDPMKKALWEIGIGAVLFLIPFIASHAGWVAEGPSWASALFVIAYIVLGGKVLATAWANMKRGQLFDENFLMVVATLGAFGLGLYNKSWEFDEAVGVMLFYRIGEYFEQKATAQSRSQIMGAVDMRPEVVNLVNVDDVKVIDAEEAEVGDIVLVRPGDRIPLDGIVIEGETRIDTSPVTGEPVPVKAGVGDEVISGCVNTNGVIKVRVEKPLGESMVTRILDSVENAAASKPQIDKFITRFSRVYTPFVVFFAIAVALIPSLLGALAGVKIPFVHVETTAEYVEYWITTALTFLVISCPCALVLSVPLAFFSGIGAASKKGILFKGGIAIEGLNNVKAVVMDKTGTITEGNFVVQHTVPAVGAAWTEEQLLAMAASCEMTSTHPIGTSIVAAANDKGLNISRPMEMEEIAGKGIKAVVDGKTVLTGNRKLMDQFGVDLSKYTKEGFGTEVLIAVDGKFAGNVVISDTIKKDAKAAIAKAHALGIVTAMLTGDAQDSAEAVAKETGIDEVHAKLMPQDKLNHLNQIREKHGAVMFVGDGINDAPVLAGADVGAAMGSGADAAIEAADVVFMTSSMEAIPQAIDVAKATNRISWQNVYFALAIKVIVMALGLVGFANMWLAVFADTGVSMLCLLNSIRILRRK